MMDLLQLSSPFCLAYIVGAVVGYFVRKSIAEAKIAGAKNAAEQIIRRCQT